MQSMQLTDWLVVIFIVAIVVVLVDGVRRKFAERRGRVVVKLDRNIPRDFDLEDLPNSELPNGGARTLVREQVPSLHTLKARRKPALKSLRPADDATARAVPVLLDTVDVEEDRIEHTNVFADPHAGESFQADDFAAADAAPAVDRAQRGSADDSDDLPDDLNEEYEEDTMLAEPTVARREPGYMETRYQGRDDDDDFDDEDFDDEEEEEDEEEDDEDFDEFDDLDDADELDDDDDDDFEDDDEDDDYDDDEDDEDDEDDDDLEEDEDLDELEGLPEDDWGSDEEQDRLVDDYENEPMPLQGALDKAASSFKRPPRQEAPRIEPGFGGAADRLDD